MPTKKASATFAAINKALSAVVEQGVVRTPNYNALEHLVGCLQKHGFSKRSACVIASTVSLEVHAIDDTVEESLDLFAQVIRQTYRGLREDFGKTNAHAMLPNITRQLKFSVEK